LRRLFFFPFLALLSAPALAEVPLQYAREDPTKIAKAESCGECHVSEYEVWKRTPHATGFKDLHRLKSAEAITKRMGFRLMKRDSACLLCHYTPTVQGEQLRAVSGVSCESCHGAGQDWIDIHNDYGGKGFDHNNETPEHRDARIAESIAAGMRRPTSLYDVAASCYGCHTVPNERLVNVGKHSIGSPGFELVAWQDEIQHNFLESFKNGDGTDNAERTPARKRMMYIAGRALELEHALRGVAVATERGVFLKAMQRRVRNALTEVRAIAAQANLSEMEEAVEIVRETDVKLGNQQALVQAAERIGQATQRLMSTQDGTQLASLDPLVQGQVAAVDLVDQLEEAEGVLTADAQNTHGETDNSEASVGPGGTAGPASANTAASGGATTTVAATVIEAIPAEGDKKTHLRPSSKFDTLSGDTCQKCHGDQNAWWFEDAHYSAIDPFLERDRKNVQIARLYGISPKRMARGESLCMDCHGTRVTGRETREVQDGVSCQGCHGPAKDFLEPHQEGEKSLGLERPGYVKALTLGMNELKNLETRAATCSGCHYITDPRLISSGHPSGIDFDYVEGMGKIRHWQSPPRADSALQDVFSNALAKRGAVPKVRLARLAKTVSAGPESNNQGSAGDVGTETSSQATNAIPAGDTFVPRPPRAPWARPADRRGRLTADPAADLNLPAFPEIDDSTSIEDTLLYLKERLELLYRSLREEP